MDTTTMVAAEIPKWALVKAIKPIAASTMVHAIVAEPSPEHGYYLKIDLSGTTMQFITLFEDNVSIQDSVFYGSQSESFYGFDLSEAYMAGHTPKIRTFANPNPDIHADRAGAVVSTLFSSGCFKTKDNEWTESIPNDPVDIPTLYHESPLTTTISSFVTDATFVSFDILLYSWDLVTDALYDEQHCRPTLTLGPGSLVDETAKMAWGTQKLFGITDF